ncbi:MAG: chromate resistance protein ChrB domain-containing protein [Steroidobacter sp.]
MTIVITPESMYQRLGLPDSPLIVDARREQDCQTNPRLIPGAVRGDPAYVAQWSRTLPRARALSVYCEHGGETSHGVAATLALLGFPAAVLSGGIQAWTDNGNPTVKISRELNVPGGSRWVTRERPKIDRLACPWLIRRFIDPQALFFYVPAHRVRADAEPLGAEPYDITDVRFSHRGARCSFDAFIDDFDLHDPVLDMVADVVRAADTGQLEQSREAPGLLAISLGLSANFTDDLLLLEQAMPIYDALYAWCKTARDETHSWPQRVA